MLRSRVLSSSHAPRHLPSTGGGNLLRRFREEHVPIPATECTRNTVTNKQEWRGEHPSPNQQSPERSDRVRGPCRGPGVVPLVVSRGLRRSPEEGKGGKSKFPLPSSGPRSAPELGPTQPAPAGSQPAQQHKNKPTQSAAARLPTPPQGKPRLLGPAPGSHPAYSLPYFNYELRITN